MAAVPNLRGINIPSRYEILKSSPDDEDWCRALLIQGLFLRAPVWRPLIPQPEVKTVLQAFKPPKP
jgi:hypothetical protein